MRRWPSNGRRRREQRPWWTLLAMTMTIGWMMTTDRPPPLPLQLHWLEARPVWWSQMTSLLLVASVQA
jgi:hypothetical protein